MAQMVRVVADGENKETPIEDASPTGKAPGDGHHKRGDWLSHRSPHWQENKENYVL
jgi:hypothetical protein